MLGRVGGRRRAWGMECMPDGRKGTEFSLSPARESKKMKRHLWGVNAYADTHPLFLLGGKKTTHAHSLSLQCINVNIYVWWSCALPVYMCAAYMPNFELATELLFIRRLLPLLVRRQRFNFYLRHGNEAPRWPKQLSVSAVLRKHMAV